MPPGAKKSWRVGRERVVISVGAIGTGADSILLRWWSGWYMQIAHALIVTVVTMGEGFSANLTLWSSKYPFQ